MNIYYFGCMGGPGHYLFENERDGGSLAFDKTPWGHVVDGTLAPRIRVGREIHRVFNGACAIHHREGWTAIAFWDHSVDQRPGSNSGFLTEGFHTFAEMVELARKHFPSVMKRIEFELVEQIEEGSA